jgi:hypothetical protein
MPVLPSISLFCALLLTLLVAPGAGAQRVLPETARSRAEALAQSFDKSKHLSREKRGVRKEKYLEVRNTPAARANPADYSGTYEVEDFGLYLELRVEANGSAEGSGREPAGDDASVMRSFTLVNARVDGALLTGTQVYANGERQRFEGVFVNRSTFQSPTDRGTTQFGLGVAGKTLHIAGLHVTRVFYRPRA